MSRVVSASDCRALGTETAPVIACDSAPSCEASSIRVIVADDHPLIRAGVVHALSCSPGMKVVAEAADGREVLRFLEREQADVVILDVRMPNMNGLTCLDHLAERWPSVRVLMLSVEEDPDLVVDALRRGARGFVTKAARPTELAAAIHQVTSGTVILGGPHITQAIAAPKHSDPLLTGREEQILSLVADGKSNREIASVLYLSTKTVKFHLTSIFAKLGVANRTQAALAAGRRKQSQLF